MALVVSACETSLGYHAQHAQTEEVVKHKRCLQIQQGQKEKIADSESDEYGMGHVPAVHGAACN